MGIGESSFQNQKGYIMYRNGNGKAPSAIKTLYNPLPSAHSYIARGRRIDE